MVLITSNNKPDQHVAVFPFPFASHATPLLNITKKLASLAPNVIFSFFNTLESNTKIFSKNDDDKSQFANIKAYNVWDGVPNGYVFKGVPQEDIELFMVAAPETLRKAVEEAEDEIGRKVSCMVSDAFLWFVVDMAGEKQVPWVATYISEEHSLTAHVYTDLIRDKIGLHEIAEEQKNESIDFIPGMSKFRVQDLPAGIVTGNLESFFARMLHQMGKALLRASAVCVSSCDELDPIVTDDLKTKFRKLLNIGPLSLIIMPASTSTDRSNCMAWLDKQESENSVAYICFGTVARPSAAEITALAQALQESGVKFLWSLKENHMVHLPPGFVENNEKGMVVAWAPQATVLAHKSVGVFVTHFGYNSIMESIASEVPMIGRPFLGEQKLNGRLVEVVWGIGLVIDELKKEVVVESLDQILCRAEGHRMRENIRDLKQLVEKAISSNGSCSHNFGQLLDIVTNSE